MNVFSDGKCAEEEAVNYNNFKWTCCKINDTEQGTKKYYKCNFKRGSNCPAKIYLLFHASNFEVTLFQVIIQHDHTTESEQIGIRIELKDVIVKLFQNGYTTPKAILSELDKLKIIQPKASQIASFLATLRKKLYGPAQISLNYIKNWCIEKSIIPNDTFFIEKSNPPLLLFFLFSSISLRHFETGFSVDVRSFVFSFVVIFISVSYTHLTLPTSDLV